MQRDRRKRHPPARHPVLLRRVLLVLCILAVLWLGYSCMMPQLLFSARGTMIFVPDPPLRRYTENTFLQHRAIPPPHKSILEEKRKIVYYIVL